MQKNDEKRAIKVYSESVEYKTIKRGNREYRKAVKSDWEKKIVYLSAEFFNENGSLNRMGSEYLHENKMLWIPGGDDLII